MKKLILTFFAAWSMLLTMQAQVYVDQFDDGQDGSTFYGGGFSGEEANGEWTIKGDGSSGPYTPFGLNFTKDGAPIDITGNNKIFVRAKASKLGTQFRLDAKDAAGYVTTAQAITKTLISDYLVLEFDFTDKYSDGGYGGTACTSGPCPVDGTQIVELNMFINPVQGGYDGSVTLDFISVGEEPQVGPMSDVWQDHFDSEDALQFLSTTSEAFANDIVDSKWVITGNGTNVAWENVNIEIYNPATLELIDVSAKAASDKVFVRMKSNVEGTVVRIDLDDINNFVTTAGSISKVISTEWKTYEYNYAGSYQDLAYGGTACTSGPCDVNSERIRNMILFVNPGSEAFSGQVEIEYISYGTALEAGGGDDLKLEYGDHFSDDVDFVSTTGAYGLEVKGSNLVITGTGIDAPYSAISYATHDQDTKEAITVNATGNNKVFLRAKSSVENTQLRIDLLDSEGLVTSVPSFSRVIGPDYSLIELDFAGNYFDGGYGGPCDPANAPCPVDGENIQAVLLYPNPADGGFNGVIEIDYISFGAPMGADIIKYKDQFEDGDRTKITDAAGYTITEQDGAMIITGDGTAGAYAAMLYTPHNANLEDQVLDITSNNKVYVKAKATKAVSLRLDLQDADGFVTTQPSVARTIEEEYQVLEFDYTGTYMDGGYGGTACTTGPCDVDGTKINAFMLFLDADNGGYQGEVTIDWISTITPLETISNDGPVGQDTYSDDFKDNVTAAFGDAGGIVVEAINETIKFVGDGTSGQYAPVKYTLNEGGTEVRVNAASNMDKVFIRAKATADSTKFRIDLIDSKNMHTSLADRAQYLSTEYQVLEYNFTDGYQDGGYGGTGCTAGPCDVDATRIEAMNLYIAPGVGAFNGVIDLDWISFGEPLMVNVIDEDLVQSAHLYPNPFLNQVYADLTLLNSGNVSITVTDVTGKVVSNAFNGSLNAGNHQITLDVANLTPGLYFVDGRMNGLSVFNGKLIKQ